MTETVGTRIKQARHERGINRERLAVDLNVGMSTIARWETDRITPSVAMLIRIAKVLDKPLSFFIADEVAVA